MALRNFNVQQGLSLGDSDVTVIDSNANVIANTLVSNTIISTTNSNITLNPNGTGVIDVSNKNISNLARPQSDSDAATKKYVDDLSQGLNLHIPAAVGTPGANLATITGGTVTYNNGTNGYGATLTLSVALTTLDNYTILAQDRILVKDESDKTTNGIYTIDPTFKILTRALDTDQTVELDGGDFVFIQNGTKLKATGWVQTTNKVVIGTDNIVFQQFSGTGAAATDVAADVGNINIKGGTTNYVLAAKDNTGNLQYANIANYFLVNTNITTVVAGSTLAFAVDYSNTQYPGGIYTLKQLGPVTMTMSDQWSQSGSNIGTSKNSYTDYENNTTNLANVTISFNLSNANFSLQSTDNLTIGTTIFNSTSTPTLSSLLASTLNGHSSGTVTIPAANLATGVEYNGLSAITNSVSANLTNDRAVTGSGISQVTGTTLTSVAPIRFNVTALTGTFASSTVPYWSLSQTFSWSATLTSGATVASGNVTYANSAQSISGSLTSTGQTSSTSPSVDSTLTYTISSTDYRGSGANGAGTRTIPSTVNGTVSPATKYYPLFWKITNNNTLPTITVSDSHNSSNYALGQGATTSTTSSQYLWLVIPNAGNAAPLASHTFKHVFGGFDIVDTPTVTGTQTITSGGLGYNYSIYGFSGFTTASNIITTS